MSWVCSQGFHDRKTLPGSSGLPALFPTGLIHTYTATVQLAYEEMVRIRLAGLFSLVTLLFGCAAQPTSYDAYNVSESAGSAYPGYGYSPGYLGPNYYGSDVVIGGGGYWAGGKDRA